MDKITILCLTELIEKFDTDNSIKLFDNMQNVSKWLTDSVSIIALLKSFPVVQQELLNVAHFIAQGKTLTRRSCYRLVDALKNMQSEMLSEVKIVLFVTSTIKLKFRENVNVILIQDKDDCVDIAYGMNEELKYLLYMNKEEVSEELENAVDIIITFEELIRAGNECYPIDSFSYDRMYLTAKLNKIEKEKCEILLTGSSYTMAGLLEDKMPYSASNVAVNGQDLYYSLLSVKEAIYRSDRLRTIVISFAYYFFFSNMNDKPSDYMLSVLSKVNYPVYNKLHGYNGKLLPVYAKVNSLPIYEAIINLDISRDIYYNALINDLEKMLYYNRINNRPVGGLLSYNFMEKSDEQNFASAKFRADGHNKSFDLDRGLENQKLLDSFLSDMDELNKNVILFIPPVTKFYKASVSKDMINSYNQLVMPVIKKHKCCTFIDLFNNNEFAESDFQDYDHLNEKGADKLTKIIASYIK